MRVRTLDERELVTGSESNLHLPIVREFGL